MTVGDAIKELNEQHCHEMGFHVAMVPMDHLPEEMQEVELPARLFKQTYDWRYRKPDKELYTVTLTAEDMEFLGHAIEVYDRIMFDLHMKPHLEETIKKMGNMGEKMGGAADEQEH